jgi:argininosuccinate lyase
VPFRTAHHIVGTLVAAAERQAVTLDALDDDTIRVALARSEDPIVQELAGEPDIATALRVAASVDGALAGCDVVGGTAPRRVAEALAAVKARLATEG